MPSFGSHWLVLDEVSRRGAGDPSPHVAALAGSASAQPAAASLGAIGPDVPYFLEGKDLLAASADVFNVLNDIARTMGRAADLARQAGLPNFGERVKQLADFTELSFVTVQGALISAVVRVHELVTNDAIQAETEIQTERPEREWKWGDLLHNRSAGAFGRHLLQAATASRDDARIAYAFGYVSHIAADVAAHPYINQVSGGPARGFAMRHSMAEKFADVFLYNSRGVDFGRSRLYRRLTPLLNSDKVQHLGAFVSSELVTFSSQGGFGPIALPAPFTTEQFEDAFESMYSLFRYSTEDSYVPPPTPPGISIPPLPGAYGSITDAVSKIFPPPRKIKTLADALKALLYLIASIGAFLIDIARFIGDLVLGIVTYPIAAALFLFHSALYRLYRSTRWFLVLAGIAYPAPDELNGELGRQFLTLRRYDDVYPRRPLTGATFRGLVTILTGRPAGSVDVGFTVSPREYLAYPRTAVETPPTIPSLYPESVSPEFVIQGHSPDLTFVRRWETVADPSALRQLLRDATNTGSHAFGSGVELALEMCRNPQFFEQINLDADRGYAYKSWSHSGGVVAGDVIGERFVP